MRLHRQKRKGARVFTDRGVSKGDLTKSSQCEIKRKPGRCEVRKEKSSCLCSALWRNGDKAGKKSWGLATRKSQSHWGGIKMGRW